MRAFCVVFALFLSANAIDLSSLTSLFGNGKGTGVIGNPLGNLGGGNPPTSILGGQKGLNSDECKQTSKREF